MVSKERITHKRSYVLSLYNLPLISQLLIFSCLPQTPLIFTTEVCIDYLFLHRLLLLSILYGIFSIYGKQIIILQLVSLCMDPSDYSSLESFLNDVM